MIAISLVALIAAAQAPGLPDAWEAPPFRDQMAWIATFSVEPAFVPDAAALCARLWA